MKTLRLTLQVKGSLLIGGQTFPVLVDVATARGPDGIPLIPASAIKGALRIEFERLARLKYRVCDVSTEACGSSGSCIACSVFGSPGLEGKLRFQDARLRADLWKIFSKKEGDEARKPTSSGYATRPGVAISRKRKAAVEHMLFNAETIAQFIPDCVFEADVEVLRDLADEEEKLLRMAVYYLEAIGADKSRGLGHLVASVKPEPQSAGVDEKLNSPSQQGPSGSLKLTLILQEYVRVSGVKAKNNFMDSLEFIPGSSVRGAIARSFADSHGNNWTHPDVRQAFLGEPALFSEFYPTGALVSSKPIPLSARTCKTYPGIIVKFESGKRPSHGTKDTLIAATVAKKLREAGMPAVVDDVCKYCEQSGSPSPLKPIRGFYLGDSVVEPSHRMNTKTAINRSRMTSAEEQLYSYELIDTMLEADESNRIRFVGTVTELTHELESHLRALNGQSLLIGGARYRGFGKMKLRVEDLSKDIDEDRQKWEERMERLTETIREPLVAAGLAVKCLSFFSLTLLSDLILPPDNWEEQLVGKVRDALRIADRELRLEKAVSETGCRSGFSDALGMRKDLFPVIRRGSAFVFSCSADSKENILKNLPDLLRKGIGARREEGFGRVSFCDPFHIDRREQY